MRFRPERRTSAREARGVRALALLLGGLALFAIAIAVPSSPLSSTPVHGAAVSLTSTQNDSSSGSPSGTAATLCPSTGPVILGVQWNCVAVLNLTELALILASIGIVAYVFKDADRAELPGESAEVPVTAEEWEAYRRARELGIPYDPPDPEEGGEGR